MVLGRPATRLGTVALLGAAVLFASALLPVAGGEYPPPAGTAALTEAVFLIGGAAYGGLVAGLTPWGKPAWVDF